jgi:hypothetical protein
MGWLVAAVGAVAVWTAAFDLPWFMNHRKARFIAAILGVTGARIFYAVLGTTLLVMGILMAVGVIPEST